MRRLVILALLCIARNAAADPVVLSVAKDKVIVGVGASDGVGAGATLELLHQVTATDPVSKRTLRDTFPLGNLTVTRAGDHVAEAAPDAAIADRVRVGDQVRLVSESRTFADPWTAKVAAANAPLPPAEEPGAPAPDHTRADAALAVADASAARAVWQETLGQPPERRIALWRSLLDAHPGNRYAAAIRDEIASLTAQGKALEAAVAAPAADRNVELADALGKLDDRATGDLLFITPPDRARAGDAIELAFAVRDPKSAARGWLYARTRGAATYQRLPLQPDGDAYLRATIPATLVAAPGVDWFVETASGDGAPTAAIGSDGKPETIAVADVREPTPAPAGRSRVSIALDYVDFDGGLAKGYDQYSEATADFSYRFLHPVYAVRLGFGTLDGWGGPKDVIDLHHDCHDANGVFQCQRVAFTYGYVETELRFGENFAVMLRPEVGRLTRSHDANVSTGDCNQGDPNAACDVGASYGMHARVRLGPETGTNLELGVATTMHVGTLFDAAYHWSATPQVPITLAVAVTNMPVPTDFGVRLLADVGWRRLSWVYPSLRLSYQARDVDHAGFSGGVAMNFDW